MDNILSFTPRMELHRYSRRIHIIALFILMTLLSGCFKHVPVQDGPPNFYVDENKVPNAVPKMEGRAKYGNMQSYRVFGKRYYTLKTSRNYDEVGMASWYGTKFHAQRTSSGERYNMLAMTAAHKTLPLPTYVEVTNLSNKRKIIVKVNDRGPFESNRIIDLSYVAAKKLGMAGRGTALVEVKAIDPKTFNKHFLFAKNNHHPKNTFSAHDVLKQNHLVYLQVGAFHSKSNAIKLKERLASLFEAPVNISYPARGKLYRVQIGPIKDLALIDKISSRLKVLGIKSNKTYGA